MKVETKTRMGMNFYRVQLQYNINLQIFVSYLNFNSKFRNSRLAFCELYVGNFEPCSLHGLHRLYKLSRFNQLKLIFYSLNRIPGLSKQDTTLLMGLYVNLTGNSTSFKSVIIEFEMFFNSFQIVYQY